MRRVTALVTALALFLSLCACKSTAARWQEQYDLGIRYMEDSNYEEAILAFNAAIEIDPMQADAYLNLANAYIGMNDFDAAKEILEKGYELTEAQSLKDKLDELESGTIFDFWGNIRKLSGFDGSGGLQWYHIYEYDGKQTTSVTTYDASGAQTGYWDGFRYDQEGRQERGFIYMVDDGTVCGYEDTEFNEQGYPSRSTHYDLDGTVTGYLEANYDDSGRELSSAFFNADGTLTQRSEIRYDGNNRIENRYYGPDGTLWSWEEYHYDQDGRYTGSTHYNADGTKISEQTAEN